MKTLLIIKLVGEVIMLLIFIRMVILMREGRK